MTIAVLEHSPNFGAGTLARTLREYGARMRFIRVDLNEALPSDLDDLTGIISCGGPQSAYGREPWLATEMALMRDAHGAGLPVVGLCLGAQLLAAALGGEVKKSGTPELGWFDVSLSAVGREDALYAGIAWRSRQFCWHSDEVVALPGGARVLASSERSKVQAFGVGLTSYGFQYHFEWDREIILRELEISPQELAAAGISAAKLGTQTTEEAPVAERLARRLAEQIALFLMPVDRANRGVSKDLHH